MTYGIKELIKDEILGQASRVTKDVKDYRLSVCTTCPDFKRITRQCGICGCFLDVKVLYSPSECPANPPKWNAL